MPNETSAFYRWVFMKCIPFLVGEEQLKRVRLLITDGDSQEFNAVDEAIFHHLPNARRIRCAYHLVQKTWENKVPHPSLQDPPVARLCHAIKSWVYSWMNGNSCFTKQQYELSQSLLFKFLRSNCLEKLMLGNALINDIHHWLTNHIVNHENSYVMYNKTYLLCLDEYMNNAGEGMNYAQKKSDMASKPSQSMSKSAQAMHNHSEIKAKDRISNLTRMMYSTPLHIDGNVHDIDLHAQLTKRASHILLNEYVKVS
jgi:hypothetical protein